MLNAPSAYIEGHEKAQRYDSALAERYIRHTTIGDPELDPVMEEVYSLHPAELHRFIGAGIEQREAEMRAAPEPLRRFLRGFPGAGVAGPQRLSAGRARLSRQCGPHAGRVRRRRARGRVLDAHSQIVQHYRSRGGHQKAPPAEQPPTTRNLLPRRPATGTGMDGSSRPGCASCMPESGACWLGTRNGTATPGARR